MRGFACLENLWNTESCGLIFKKLRYVPACLPFPDTLALLVFWMEIWPVTTSSWSGVSDPVRAGKDDEQGVLMPGFLLLRGLRDGLRRVTLLQGIPVSLIGENAFHHREGYYPPCSSCSSRGQLVIACRALAIPIWVKRLMSYSSYVRCLR